LGEVLLARGKITAEHLQAALAARKGATDRLDRILVRMGFVQEREVLDVLAEQLSLRVVELSAEKIDVDLLRSMPSRLIHRRKLVPIGRDAETLWVATSDPFDVYAFDELRMMTGLRVEPVLASEQEINNVIKQYYGVGGETIDQMMDEEEVELIRTEQPENGDLLEMAQEASVVKLVNEILVEAVSERATDVHIEPREHDLRIRYRIDGVLHNANVPPQIRRFQLAIISRIKILSSLNIAEKRMPQDGSFKIRVHNREIDIRVSVIPMQFGEGVVLRLLDKQQLILSMPELGMPEPVFAVFKTLIQLPHGIILVTGPTGCGKTTTLYAAINQIVSDEIKVVTIEQPVEYDLPGVNQVPVNTKVGLTFAHGLRSFLRHDPDVIMVGEIRDLETAEVAVQASLTGHMVFSTLHTNDAASATTRLLDMGVEPFLVTATVEGIMAQRLLRTICPNCKVRYELDTQKIPPDLPYDGEPLYRGRGCRECRNSGYRGRTGVFELLVMNEEIRDLVMQRSSPGRIIEAGRRNGLVLLREDGWRKVLEGVTTPEEVLRVSKL
jgi:general secretion pathway protein E/type IV pilus assembly protein PilB